MNARIRKFFLKFIQKHFLTVKTDILPGDLICHVNNETLTFEAIGVFYSYELRPFIFFKDVTRSAVYSAPIHEYKRAPITAYFGPEVTLL